MSACIKIAAIVSLCAVGIGDVQARTLTLMPPAKYDGCKPICKVEVKRQAGSVSCGGLMVPACTFISGDKCVIHISTSLEASVQRDMLRHERAHTCGWPASHPGGWWPK